MRYHNFRRCNYSSIAEKDRKSTITIEKMGPITLIGINRPEKRNCIDRSTSKQLDEAFSEFESDRTSLASVLHGIGGNFCSGHDLEEISRFDEAEIEEFRNDLRESGSGSMGPTRRVIAKPVIAALEGYVVGGGMELALMCDLRVADDTVVMGLFNRRFGFPLLDGGTVRLPKIVGLSRALDLVLTGRRLDAKEAFEWGLVNKRSDKL